jgi:hypothetical protein
MPRQGKGPHLWWRKAQYDKSGRLTHVGSWHIKDGRSRHSTGCGYDDRVSAEHKLEEYLSRKRLEQTAKSKRSPSQIYVADVIALYLAKKAPKLARENEIKARCKNLLAFFGRNRLSEITSDLCEGYVEHRGSRGIARRELEDLRAAINYYLQEEASSGGTKFSLYRALVWSDARARMLEILWSTFGDDLKVTLMILDDTCQARRILAPNRIRQNDVIDRLKESISRREGDGSLAIKTSTYRDNLNIIISMP